MTERAHSYVKNEVTDEFLEEVYGEAEPQEIICRRRDTHEGQLEEDSSEEEAYDAF